MIYIYRDGINSIATRSFVPLELPELHFANAGGMTDIVAQGFNLGVLKIVNLNLGVLKIMNLNLGVLKIMNLNLGILKIVKFNLEILKIGY